MLRLLHSSPRRKALVALFVLGAVGCSGGEVPPVWVHLAEGFRAGSPAAAIAGWKGDAALSVRDAAGGTGVWIDTPIPREAWLPLERANAYRTPRPDTPGFRHFKGEVHDLRVAGRSLRSVGPEGILGGSSPVGDGLFAVSLDDVLVALPEGAAAPEGPDGIVLGTFLPRGEVVDGRWRAEVTEIVGDALTVWPGERVELVRDVPPASALRFRFVAEALGEPGRVGLRVTLEDEVVVERELEITAQAVVDDVTAALPRAGDGLRFGFEVSGVPASSAFFDPIVGPLEVGTYGARPWEVERPDLVLFIADTFRADLLSPWGGAPEIAPNLNALAERSVRFLQARATGVWTLPTHASMFTGLFPTQHNAITKSSTFPASIVTIAEHLAAHGYRTGAVTESVFVSRHFALDQGFSWFEERRPGSGVLRRTLARALDFLAQDDGRPVFLLVHTYRTHMPYRLDGEEEADAVEALFRRVGEELRRLKTEAEGEVDPHEVYAEHVDELRAIYDAAATALDRRFGPWLEEVESRGVLEDGYLVFTSDHGEEFYEHGRRAHSWSPHEETVRIPLLLLGPDLAPRDVELGVSQVDLAPTLAELAGVPRVEGWMGRSLLSIDAERPLFAHNLRDQRQFLAFFEGRHKVFATDGPAFERGELEQVYDLGADPREAHDLASEPPPWSRDLIERATPLWRLISVPVGEATDVELDEKALQDLKDLGYVE